MGFLLLVNPSSPPRTPDGPLGPEDRDFGGNGGSKDTSISFFGLGMDDFYFTIMI